MASARIRNLIQPSPCSIARLWLAIFRLGIHPFLSAPPHPPTSNMYIYIYIWATPLYLNTSMAFLSIKPLHNDIFATKRNAQLFFFGFGFYRTPAQKAHVKLSPGFQTNVLPKMRQTREMLNISELETLRKGHVKLFPGFQTNFFPKMHQTREMLNMSDLQAHKV